MTNTARKQENHRLVATVKDRDNPKLPFNQRGITYEITGPDLASLAADVAELGLDSADVRDRAGFLRGVIWAGGTEWRWV